jgi:exonuclease-1
MGISGLLPRLQSITTDVNISAFAGKVVAVDGYVWLHRGSYSCSAELCQNIPTDKYISYFMHMVGLLTHNGITPLIVFDGNGLPAKSLQEDERHKKREENRQKAFELLRQGKRSQAHEAFQRCVDVTPAMAARVIRVLETQKVKSIVAPYEADAQLAYLVQNGHADAVISEDSDLLAFGCTTVIFKMDKFGNGKQIDLADLPKNQEIQFVVFLFLLLSSSFFNPFPGLDTRHVSAYVHSGWV